MIFADTMIGSSNSIFHVANDDIEPVKRFYSLGITTITGRSHEVNVTTSSQGIKASKAI
jgi:hypothetical protein